MKPPPAPRPGPPVRPSPSRAPNAANQHAPSHRANGCCPGGNRAHASPTTTARRYARSSARTDTSQPPHRRAPGDQRTTPRQDRATPGPGAAHPILVRHGSTSGDRTETGLDVPHGEPTVTGPRPVPMSPRPSGAWRTDARRQHRVAPAPGAHTGRSPGTVEAHRPERGGPYVGDDRPGTHARRPTRPHGHTTQRPHHRATVGRAGRPDWRQKP